MSSTRPHCGASLQPYGAWKVQFLFTLNATTTVLRSSLPSSTQSDVEESAPRAGTTRGPPAGSMDAIRNEGGPAGFAGPELSSLSLHAEAAATSTAAAVPRTSADGRWRAGGAKGSEGSSKGRGR